MIYCMQNKSTWSYENRVSKHFVIFRNFPLFNHLTCMYCCLLYTSDAADE